MTAQSIPTPESDEEVESAHNIALWCDTGKHGYKDATHAEVVPIAKSRSLEQRLAVAVGALRSVEWVFDGELGKSYCPSCDRCEDAKEHRPDCKLAEALKTIEEIKV